MLQNIAIKPYASSSVIVSDNQTELIMLSYPDTILSVHNVEIRVKEKRILFTRYDNYGSRFGCIRFPVICSNNSEKSYA